MEIIKSHSRPTDSETMKWHTVASEEAIKVVLEVCS